MFEIKRWIGILATASVLGSSLSVTQAEQKLTLPGVETPFSHFNQAALDAVSFISVKVGFVAGNDGIYKTTNGGKTWKRVYASKDPILGIEAKYQPVGPEQYVVAYTKTYLIRSIDGEHFAVQGVGSGADVEGVSLLNNNQIYLLNNGVVWASNGESGALYRTKLTNSVDSISATWDSKGMAVCYAVAGMKVYKTDSEEHWSKVFTFPVKLGRTPWRGTIQASTDYVWLTIYGGQTNKRTGEEAYLIFASKDGGSTWTPEAANEDDRSLYKGVHLPAEQNIGQKPLSMSVLPSGEAVFASQDTVVEKTLISNFTFRKPKFLRSPLTATNQANAFDNTSSVDVFFVDDIHGWIVGSNQGKGYVYSSGDGGLTWNG